MTWTRLTQYWPALGPLMARAFPHAPPSIMPNTPADMSSMICDLATQHDLTETETAEILDDLIFTAASTTPDYVSEVTHKMVASS